MQDMGQTTLANTQAVGRVSPMQPSDATRIAIAVCTYKRPHAISALLDVIATRSPSNGFEVVIVVVDDDPCFSAQAAATGPGAGAEATRPLPIQYIAHGSENIASARNRAIETAATIGDFIVCIDDDCTPDASWIRELVGVANTFTASIVVGHREFVATDASPPWLSSEPFLAENERYPNESVPAIGNVANVLIRSSWLLQSGVRFRDALGELGGEDMAFFADARSAGAEIRFAANSIVHEPYDARRSTLRYQLWRQTWLGNNEAHINRTVAALGTARLILRGIRRATRGIAWPLTALRSGDGFQWRWGLAQLLNGCGLIAGALGTRMKHHS